ncbi:hypothetical protein D3C86_2160880 [compost metagenome]
MEFVQDGTRLSEEDRNLLDLSHRKVLAEHGIQFIEICGNWEERFEQALAEIRQVSEGITFPVRTSS